MAINPRSSLILTALFYCQLILLGSKATARPSNEIRDSAVSFPVFKNYTAVGDSFASGDGDVRDTSFVYLEYDPSWACKRTRDSYPWQLYLKYLVNDLEAFNDVSCSGANTSQIFQQVNTGPEVFSIKEGRPGYNFGTPDLVTINAGGNNNDVVWLIIDKCVAAIRWHPLDSDHSGVYEDGCRNALKEAHELLDTLLPQLEDLYSLIKTHNLLPGQKRSVYVLGYARLWNANANWEICDNSEDIYVPPLGPDSFAEQMNNLLLKMNGIIKFAAMEHGFHFVDIDGAFEGHRICDTEDYTYQNVRFQKSFWTFVANRKKYAPFHPTPAGYTAMMEFVAHAIRADANQ